MRKRVYRSKYNFSRLEVGDTFQVQALDLQSMKNSLRFHNNTHKKDMVVEVVGEEKVGDKVVSIELKRIK